MLQVDKHEMQSWGNAPGKNGCHPVDEDRLIIWQESERNIPKRRFGRINKLTQEGKERS